jgi:hypothetical protein
VIQEIKPIERMDSRDAEHWTTELWRYEIYPDTSPRDVVLCEAYST